MQLIIASTIYGGRRGAITGMFLRTQEVINSSVQGVAPTFFRVYTKSILSVHYKWHEQLVPAACEGSVSSLLRYMRGQGSHQQEPKYRGRLDVCDLGLLKINWTMRYPSILQFGGSRKDEMLRNPQFSWV